MTDTSIALRGDTTDAELEQILAAAAEAYLSYGRSEPAARVALLDAVADAIDAASEGLIEVAMRESRLAQARLQGEVRRTTFQLRLFGHTVQAGGYLDARLDSPDAQWPTGPRPDIRSMLIPTGPVLNFAASNFPFAFSVAGGDTAAALAAGCPVIVKAHSAHPELSQRVGDIVTRCVQEQGLPAGVFALVYGGEAARAALTDPRVKVGTFTGSPQGGRALLDLANSRPEPIPFFAEMGSVNPVFVTAAALDERLPEIAKGYAESFTLGVGQFCTKPGLLLLPQDRLAEFVEAVSTVLTGVPPATMLTDRIRDSFIEGAQNLHGQNEVRTVVDGEAQDGQVGPRLFTTTAGSVLADPRTVLTECFGPASVLITYGSDTEFLALARLFTGELTASIHHASSGRDDVPAELVATLERAAGRIIFNQWPTGVSVTHAMVHGGPYPASSNYGATSVGTTSIERFLRRAAYQNSPDQLLPAALRDDNPWRIPRTVDGRLVTSAG